MQGGIREADDQEKSDHCRDRDQTIALGLEVITHVRVVAAHPTLTRVSQPYLQKQVSRGADLGLLKEVGISHPSTPPFRAACLCLAKIRIEAVIDRKGSMLSSNLVVINAGPEHKLVDMLAICHKQMGGNVKG